MALGTETLPWTVIRDLCAGFMECGTSHQISYTYQQCKSGIFSSVYKFDLILQDEHTVTVLKKSFICKQRFQQNDAAIDAETQTVSYKFQSSLSLLNLSPKVFYLDVNTGLEIHNYAGAPQKPGTLESKCAAELLAKLHCQLKVFSDTSEVPKCWTDFSEQSRRLTETLEKVTIEVCSQYDAMEGYDWLVSELKKVGAVKKLCHNDFYANNILVNNDDDGMNKYYIIDFDMISMNWWGYDVASFFFTQCREDTSDGNVNLTLSKLPKRKDRRRFIQFYLNALKELNYEDTVYSYTDFCAIVDLLMCFGWLFSAVTRFEVFMIHRQGELIDEIRTRLKFFNYLKAKWVLERDLLKLYAKKESEFTNSCAVFVETKAYNNLQFGHVF